MVERYLPGITERELDDATKRLTAAVKALTRRGVRIRYLSSTFVPAEESCFSRFESAAADDVRRAFEEAHVPFARIVETRDLYAGEKQE